MKTYEKRKQELDEEIGKFNQALKDWNNKELDDDVRKKAEDYVDKETDEGRGELILEANLKGLEEGYELGQQEELEFLKSWFKRELADADAYLNDKGEIRTTYDNDLIESDLWEELKERIKKLEKKK